MRVAELQIKQLSDRTETLLVSRIALRVLHTLRTYPWWDAAPQWLLDKIDGEIAEQQAELADLEAPLERKPITHKRCVRCSETQVVANFPLNSQAKHGIGSWCRRCHAEYTRAYELANKDERLAKKRIYDQQRLLNETEEEKIIRRAKANQRYHQRRVAMVK